jgi:hypothetical protein
VIDGGHCEIRTSNLSPRRAQSVKRLRRSYLVNEMQIDVEQRRLSGGGAHHVSIPEFVE